MIILVFKDSISNIMKNKVERSMETRKKLNNYNTEYEHRNKEINATSNLDD